MAIRPSHILSTVLFACAALGPVHAAELGDARVRSHIGQALAADVELTLVDDTSRQVEVRLAHPDVYRGANVAMPAVLSSLDIAVIRQGGKQFLHLTSSKPVESRHLHVYLELVDGGQRAVRLVTLWFTPDPHPAPAPASSPAPVLAAAPAVAEPPAASKAPAPARPVRAATPARKPAPTKRRPAPDGEAHDVQAAAVAVAPKAPAHEPKAPAAPATAQAGAIQDAHAARHDAAAAAPASCAAQALEAQTNACAVLGAKNDALRQELGQLEEKVKVLQVASGVKSAAEATAQSAPKPDEKPKSAPRIHRKPKPAAPPEEPMPWLAIAGGIAALLALLGGVVLLRRRRAAAARVLTPAREPEVVVLPQDGAGAPGARPRFMAAVKARLMALRPARQASAEAPATLDEKTIIQPE